MATRGGAPILRVFCSGWLSPSYCTCRQRFPTCLLLAPSAGGTRRRSTHLMPTLPASSCPTGLTWSCSGASPPPWTCSQCPQAPLLMTSHRSGAHEGGWVAGSLPVVLGFRGTHGLLKLCLLGHCSARSPLTSTACCYRAAAALQAAAGASIESALLCQSIFSSFVQTAGPTPEACKAWIASAKALAA